VAGATYGALQIGVQRWLARVRVQETLNAVLNGNGDVKHTTAVYSVLTPGREGVGLALGAAEHNRVRIANRLGYCESCSLPDWQRFWTGILSPWKFGRARTCGADQPDRPARRGDVCAAVVSRACC
jgi:hypothetical protein